MNLSAKGRYAVTAMLDLALHVDSGTIPLGDIVERQGISQSYLEQLFSKLRKAGLLDSVRGPGGGYQLARPASQISVANIVDAVDEITDNRECQHDRPCSEDKHCLAHSLWCQLSSEIRAFLNGTTLDDLTNRTGIQTVARRQDKQQQEKVVDFR